ncbi:4-hydroxy-tetrahydrodipicolinate synthase [Sanguibacteroides justesenii]|uniref:4-hydroxy-tetrahydrodipicolinate synthase n=1 Tax=Sanguibacteroides justesenii TaxID=1547597 RepID=UPI000D857B19|nr:4-hydroxy-tetrahydrodipicolinate synthase [Sanguibacteroides justesenii]PXZ43725.1 4-hydroxy-tetrahydrodipicolinate synthase [Sanguibacteroides justesenii]
MKKFSGVGVALITPFTNNGQVDEISLRGLVDHVIDNGVDYLVALGTTSEAATLSAEEKERVVNIIAEQNGGRLPLVLGVGGNNTQQVLQDLNTLPYVPQADAILSVTPYYNKPSQEGLYRHFKMIAEKSSLPVILYNVPGRTSVNMAAQTTLRLAHDFKNIIGIKEASGNFEQATAILKDKQEKFLFISGDDGITLPLMSIGCCGVISVIANAFPKEFTTMVHLASEMKFDGARKIHFELSELCKALFEEGNPAGIKAALHLKKVIACNKLRTPLTEVSEKLYQKLTVQINEL